MQNIKWISRRCPDLHVKVGCRRNPTGGEKPIAWPSGRAQVCSGKEEMAQGPTPWSWVLGPLRSEVSDGISEAGAGGSMGGEGCFTATFAEGDGMSLVTGSLVLLKVETQAITGLCHVARQDGQKAQFSVWTETTAHK